MPTLYRIKDWERFYEVSDSKKVAGPLQWVAIRTKSDGFGYLRITQESDRTDLFAAWVLMLSIAAKQPKGERGKLARDGVPLTPEDMELLTRFPAQIFRRALVFFSDPRQGWIVSEQVGCDPEPSGCVRMPSEPSGPTGQDNTGQYNTPPLPPAGELALDGRPLKIVDLPPVGPVKSDLQFKVEALFRRRATTPWSAAEQRAWKTAKAVVDETAAEDWALMEWWYGLQPRDAPYRKTDMAALLNNWHAEIEKARRNRDGAAIHQEPGSAKW